MLKFCILFFVLGGAALGHAERVPLLATEVYIPLPISLGTHLAVYKVLTRTDNPLVFEHCTVNIRNSNLVERVNAPAANCRVRYEGLRDFAGFNEEYVAALSALRASQVSKERWKIGSGSALFVAGAIAELALSEESRLERYTGSAALSLFAALLAYVAVIDKPEDVVVNDEKHFFGKRVLFVDGQTFNLIDKALQRTYERAPR